MQLSPTSCHLVFPLMSTTSFLTRTELQAKLQYCVFKLLCFCRIGEKTKVSVRNSSKHYEKSISP
jgi:hypothetical protein